MHFGEQLSEERLADLARKAYEKGVRTFVTSDVYGAGRADELIGEALEGYDRDTYCLVGLLGHDIYEGKRQGSKGFQRFTDPELRGESEYASYLQMAAEKSLARCRTDRFDLVMLHNPDTIGFSEPSVWEAMSSLKTAGLTEEIGIAPGPANGFIMDLIYCLERFGEEMDWVMAILNPLEPWPQRHALPVAKHQNVNVMTRVVDYGGLFHDVVRPGHEFRDGDHRSYRPAGWVDHAYPKLEAFRKIADEAGLTLLQLACHWDLAQPAVKCVVPTLIQEAGEGVKSVEEELEELAQVSVLQKNPLTMEQLLEIERMGDNEGCMALKGASERYADQEERQADTWPVRPELLEVAQRYGLNPSW